MKKIAFAALALIVLAGCGQTPNAPKAAKKTTASKTATKSAGASAAATADKGLVGMFRLAHAHLDANRDGALDAQEFAVAIEEEVFPGLPDFAAIDKDGDGAISVAEFTHKDLLKGRASLFTDRVKSDFAGFDANADKALSKAEMADADVAFAAADADKNGKVTVAEYEVALAHAMSQPAK